jgi:hypothetical protein
LEFNEFLARGSFGYSFDKDNNANNSYFRGSQGTALDISIPMGGPLLSSKGS